MNTYNTKNNKLAESTVSVNVKISSLWASFMFLYIYVDYFHLYMPGSLETMLAGKMFVFDVTQAVILTGLVSVTIPALMIFLSIVMPPRLNQWTNIVVAVVYIPYTLFNLAGLAWIHMMFAAAVEVVLLMMIVRYAWKWPRVVS